MPAEENFDDDVCIPRLNGGRGGVDSVRLLTGGIKSRISVASSTWTSCKVMVSLAPLLSFSD